LAFANNMTIDAIDAIPEIGVSKLISNTTHSMSFDAWAKWAVVLILLFVGLFLMYYFTYGESIKRFSFVSSIASLILACVAVTFAFHKFNLDKNDKPAIVFAKESPVKSEPNLRSEEAFRLHEGTKIQILETVNNWKKVKLSDGKEGWISNNDIKAL
jgi:hypothetical protein